MSPDLHPRFCVFSYAAGRVLLVRQPHSVLVLRLHGTIVITASMTNKNCSSHWRVRNTSSHVLSDSTHILTFCISSYPHILTFCTSSHPHILHILTSTRPHILHILTSTHILTFCTSSHSHILTSIPILTYSLTHEHYIDIC